MEVYRNGGNQKMNSDFGQIILDQINEKQKLLVEENTKLERDYQRYKSESEKYKKEIDILKENLENNKTKLRESTLN